MHILALSGRFSFWGGGQLSTGRRRVHFLRSWVRPLGAQRPRRGCGVGGVTAWRRRPRGWAGARVGPLQSRLEPLCVGVPRRQTVGAGAGTIGITSCWGTPLHFPQCWCAHHLPGPPRLQTGAHVGEGLASMQARPGLASPFLNSLLLLQLESGAPGPLATGQGAPACPAGTVACWGMYR